MELLRFGGRLFVQNLADCLVLDAALRQRVAGNLEQRLGDYFDEEFDYPRAFPTSQELRIKPPREQGRKL
ncbi:MAG: hypothetical protein M3P51_08990, partial [Chloroflexota bacterium]|nr:hypothetical protein [Chloroflexota bacterium]